MIFFFFFKKETTSSLHIVVLMLWLVLMKEEAILGSTFTITEHQLSPSTMFYSKQSHAVTLSNTSSYSSLPGSSWIHSLCPCSVCQALRWADSEWCLSSHSSDAGGHFEQMLSSFLCLLWFPVKDKALPVRLHVYIFIFYYYNFVLHAVRIRVEILSVWVFTYELLYWCFPPLVECIVAL